LGRLAEVVPARFGDTPLRTIQRAVKAWRCQIARKIILDGVGTLIDGPPPFAPAEAAIAGG